jgi:hypothetical protein
LDSRRIELVHNLFEKYESTISVGIDLDAELFMQELEKSKDLELLALSRSPLFLTVMSYVYASDIRRKGHSTVFKQGAYEITFECISLLISELDAAKARDLSDAQRQALMNRRSSFPEEKLAFLKYFSVQLYERSIGLFDRNDLRNIAYNFFQSFGFADNRNANEIIGGLDDPDPTTNILEQIILSGIFSLVDRRNGNDYFDFPHRRFRETLAISYFNNANGAEALIRHLRNPEYSELILVYVRQSPFSVTLLKAMIDDIVKTGSYPVCKLLASALAERPKEEAHSLVCDLLVRINPDSVPDLPSSLVGLFMLNDDSRRLVFDNIRSACEMHRDRWLMLWLRLASKFGMDVSQSLIRVADLTFLQARIFLYEGVRCIRPIEDAVLERFVTTGIAESAEPSILVEDGYMALCGGKDLVARKGGLAALRRLRERLSSSDGQAYKDICESISKVLESIEEKGVWEGGGVRPPAPRSPLRVGES